jgi:transposase
VEGLDLSPLYAKIKSVKGSPGRDATDPRVLMALWLYATLDGVGSARALARLTKQHDVYRWICGGVSTNYHTLADFRVQEVEFLDNLLTTSVATLMAEGLVDLQRVAQDGVRVRASAGAASFRRKPTLERCLKKAEEQVEALKKELEEDPNATNRRQQAARKRTAAERKERVDRALKQLPEAEAKKKKADKDKARVSTTDPDARVMKMGDGGFRPAFNGQFAVDTETQVVAGVDVSNEGSDQAQMSPMLDQLEDRYDHVPDEYLADGGFAAVPEIEGATERGTTVFAPVRKPRDPARDRYEPRPGDSKEIADWRERMGTATAKAIYRDRASSVECVNGHVRNRGLQQFLVRGLEKVRAVLLWHALAQNLARANSLRSAAAAAAA